MAGYRNNRGRTKRLRDRIADHSAAFAICSVPGCTRQTARAAGVGLHETLCTYHRQQHARHGSALASSYRATELAPYLRAALAHISATREDPLTAKTLGCLSGLLQAGGPLQTEMDLRGRPARFRARNAFARLREAGVTPERLLAIHLGMAALIKDDRDAIRTEDFFRVQVAKAAHRLASGTHRKWQIPLSDGRILPAELHRYPRSSGRVLRLIGAELDDLCSRVTERDVEAVLRLKLKRSGPHTSHLPGWLPRWRRQYDAARQIAAGATR